jgi:hypothetical protein
MEKLEFRIPPFKLGFRFKLGHFKNFKVLKVCDDI